MEKTVVVTQIRLTHYRVTFFEALRHHLSLRGVNLILLHGQPAPNELSKQDEGFLDWAIRVTNKYYKLSNQYLVWQPIPSSLDDFDLIVITQENRIISNYYHLLMHYRKGYKVAFWGHGANFQSKKQNSLKEQFKRWSNNFVDWWFAYTQMSFDLVEASGFPADKVTVLNNSIDTSEFKKLCFSITPHETKLLRESLGFISDNIGVFVGSLYPDKRLDFLFSAADEIKKIIPDFSLLIVGEGNEAEKVQLWCANRPWAKWVGARFGREKALYISMAKLMLNPGLVGLGILDSFVSTVPIITTDCGIHSPEIAYLDNGINGVMTINDLDAYVAVCVDLFSDINKLNILQDGCRASAEEYTIDNMVIRFADGIIQCLQDTSSDILC